jgi:hypothetical protein
VTRDGGAARGGAAGDAAGPRWDADDAAVVLTGVAYAVLAALPWYEVRDAGGRVLGFVGWGLGWTMVAGLLALYAAGRVLLLRWRPAKPDVPVTPAAETFVVVVVALLLTLYRAVVVPGQVGPAATRTSYLSFATAAVVFQAIFAARKLAKTGVRA